MWAQSEPSGFGSLSSRSITARIPTRRYPKWRLSGNPDRRTGKSMSELSSPKQSGHSALPGLGQRVSILGVPLGFGQSMAGVDLGPSPIRLAGLSARISQLWYRVLDPWDLEIETPPSHPPASAEPKYLSPHHRA